MRIRVAGFLVILVLAVQTSLWAAEKQYAPGKIIDLQQKTNTKVLYYIANTPVTQDEPYFEITVQAGAVQYSGLYTPKHADETLPVEWQPGAEVEVRTDNHHLYLRKFSGVEIAFVIAKRMAIMKASPKDSAATSDGK